MVTHSPRVEVGVRAIVFKIDLHHILRYTVFGSIVPLVLVVACVSAPLDPTGLGMTEPEEDSKKGSRQAEVASTLSADSLTSAISDDEFRAKYRSRYEESVKRAAKWLRELDADPIALREKGLKGKKKFVELLTAYMDLHRLLPPEDRPAIRRRILQITKVTELPAYHDMETIPAKQFSQDSTSYFRACYLMEKFGLPTERYRENLSRVVSRVDGHLESRGANGRMVFEWYYAHFGFDFPPEHANAATEGLIASRQDPSTLSLYAAYLFTHEIFVPNDFGESVKPDAFDDHEKEYIANAITVLIDRYTKKKNVDIVSELLSSIIFAGIDDPLQLQKTVLFLLEHQRKDGSWGYYDGGRKAWGDLLEVNFTLHTTAVTLAALADVFQPEHAVDVGS